jgi:hypothetical protein
VTFFPCAALAQRQAPEAQRPDAQIATQPKSDLDKTLDAIQDFLEEKLDAKVSYEIKSYSDAQGIRFLGDKAVVLRVAYQLSDQQGGSASKDQLFLVHEGKVKQLVDFAAWQAEQQRIQQLLMAQLAALQQQQMAPLAQPPAQPADQFALVKGSSPGQPCRH